MQSHLSLCRRLWAYSLLVVMVSPAYAGPPSDSLLPNSAKGYVSVAQPRQFQERWEKTQLGQLVSDETMQAFVDDFRKQMNDEFGAVRGKLGIIADDLKGVTAGELSVSIIERKDQDAAIAITIDVTGREKEAAGLIEAAGERLAARTGQRTTKAVGDTTLTIFSVPAGASGKPQQTVYFIKDNVLVGVDDLAIAEGVLKRFDGAATDNLKSVPAYQATMERCRKEAGTLEPEARWFIEPFGAIAALRTLRQGERRKEQDMATILRDNGFDAIQGAGGFVNQLVDGHIEFLVRTSVYAPAIKGKEDDPLRWNLSMRMLQLPNGPAVEPQSWVPRMLASYSTMNLSLVDAFDNVGPVFDAIQEHEDAWRTTLEGWTSDKYGPQVDVRKEFIGNMNNRISVLTAYDTPIDVNSERSLFAIEAKDEQALTKTLERWMKNERDVTRREVGPFVVWERTSKDNAVEEPRIEIKGFETKKSSKSGAPKRERERVLPSSAVTVALGHLMLASDADYLVSVLEGHALRERLASSGDYQQMFEIMNRLVPGERSAWAFGRGEEEVRPMYELVREGRMPESKSMVGKLLNNMFTTEADRSAGMLRKQSIDGASLPEFESVRRYFSPHARVVVSEPDGWFITGAVVNKEAP